MPDRKFSDSWRRSYEHGGDRPHHYRPHSYHYYDYGYLYPRVYFSYGYHSPYWWWGYPYSYPYDYPRSRYYGEGQGPGALDLDVRPEKAEVFIDGQYVGVADNFDGFPSYLWLEEGSYHLVLFKEGYETIARKVTIYPGLTIDVEDQMVAGEATPLEALPAEYRSQPAEELRRDRERDQYLASKEDEWRQRARDYRERKETREGEVQPPLRYDTREEPGRLFLKVEPEDASIYLDGRFLGTADELSRLHAGLIVEPGEHVLEVVRPGYTSGNETFELDSGQDLELDIDLSKGGA